MQDLANKSTISIIRVNNEKELRRYNVDAIANVLFGSDATRLYPIYLVFHHGRLLGYFHAVQQLVVYPALHPDPEKMTPEEFREFMEVGRSLVTEFKKMSGNPLFMLCEKMTKVGAKNMRRIRLKQTEETAFMYDEEAE
jgi:hypothetical protein